MDIADQIGDKYDSFSICLLDDTQGVHLSSIKQSGCAGQKLNNILHEVFVAWLAGSGKKPVTWMTFVKCLRDVNLNTLADTIENEYESDNLEESETTTQEKKASTKDSVHNMESSDAETPMNTNKKDAAPGTSSEEANNEHWIQDRSDVMKEFLDLQIWCDAWKNVCRALNISEKAMITVSNDYNSGTKRLQLCVFLFFNNNAGTVTWEKIIRALALNLHLKTFAKVIAWRKSINFYEVTHMERPTVPQNHQKINYFWELNNVLVEPKFHDYYDFDTFCKAFNVDLTTIPANLDCTTKLQFCIHDYFDSGIGTWEDVMKRVAGSPLNDVVFAKRIGKYRKINYYTAVGQAPPSHSSQPYYHKIEYNITALTDALEIIPYEDWEELCKSLNVDEQTMTDLKRRRNDPCSDKWQFCLNDYLQYGAATWEDIVRILASTFGRDVEAKKIAEEHGINYQEVMTGHAKDEL